MSTLNERFEKLKSLQITYIGDKEIYDNRSKKAEILAEMPDLEAFEAGKKVKKSLFNKKKDAPELKMFFEQPLLSHEQQMHLFRKMNFYKYKIKYILDKCKVPRKFILDLIDSLLEKQNKISNEIMLSNTRLIVGISKRHPTYLNTQDKNVLMDLVSDGILGLLIAIKGFDYRLGYKFSTYATYAIKDKISSIRTKIKKENDFAEGIDSLDDFADNKLSNDADKKDLIEAMFEKVKNLTSKEQEVIIRYYQKNNTLQEISKAMNISRERVRQIKENALNRLRSLVLNMPFKSLKAKVKVDVIDESEKIKSIIKNKRKKSKNLKLLEIAS